MKKNILFLLTILGLFSLNSCEDNFDPKIYGSLGSTNYPQSESDYETYTMTCYTPFVTQWVYWIGSGLNQHGFYIPEGGVLRMFDSTSDAAPQWKTGWGDEWLRMTQANFSNCIYYYRDGISASNLNHIPKLAHITRFTEIIGTLQNAPENVLSQEKKNLLLGEAHLCRGIMLYYMLHLYGPLPAILNPEDVKNDEKLEDLTRPTLNQMTEWITADFDYAIKNIAVAAKEKGRYNRDYAKVCLMRHYLNEGYHMDGYYQKAIDLYGELSQSGYKLFQQGSNPFADLFKNANKFNSEIIMAVSCTETADGSYKSGNFNPIMMLAVPEDAARVDEHGNPTPFNLQGPGWGQNFNVSPKFYETYAAADKRKDVVVTSYWSTKGIRIGESNLGSSWDGYIINKFPIETATPFQGTDIPLARWADVLLMFAEAEVRKTNSAPSSEAIAAVNQVRNRAGLENLPAQSTVNAEAFLNAILTERGHEFLYEGFRKIDLIRFNKYAQLVYKSKGVVPTHQYMPLPNYFVEQAKSYGKNISQTFEREGWQTDLNSAK